MEATAPAAPAIAEAATPPPVERLRPHAIGLRWLVNLYFRPGRALDRPGLAVSAVTLIAAMWVMGACWVINTASAQAPTGAAPEWTATWSGFWGLAMVGGMVWGAVRLVTLGSLFRLRLWLAGARGVTFEEAYRLYLLASLVAALPILLVTVVASAAYPTPQDAAENAPGMVLLLAILPFWSCWAAYRGARVALGARRGPAIFWLLVLPWGLLGAVFAAAFAAAVALAGAPDLSRTVPFRTAAISMTVPGNWLIDVEPAAPAPSWVVVACDEFGDARFEASMFHAAWTPEEALREYTLELMNNGNTIVNSTPLDRWGWTFGTGARIETTFEGEPMEFQVLVWELGEGLLAQACAVAAKDRVAAMRPAFEHMVNSLEFTPPALQAADIQHARPWKNRLFTVRHPGNWGLEAWSGAGAEGPGVSITAPDGSWFGATVFRSEATPIVALWNAVRFAASAADEAEIIAEPDHYGGLPCVGRSLRATAGGHEAVLNFYVIPLKDGSMLEVREVRDLAGSGRNQAGFELLCDSLQLQGAEVDLARLAAPAPDEPILGSASPRF